MSAHTASAYRIDLSSFSQWVNEKSLTRWAQLDSQHVRQFAAETHRAGLSPRSIQRRLSAIRGFYGYLAREGVATNNPATDVRAPKAAKHLPRTLDVDQMSRLLQDLPVKVGKKARQSRGDESALELRDHAALELLYSSGLRLSELIGLNLVDVDLKDRTARVLGKGSKTRIVPIGSHAIKALQKWLNVRGSVATAEELAVFVGRNGKRLGARALQLRVADWAKPRRAYPSALVQTFLRLASVGVFRGFARRTRTTGPRQHQYDPDLHASRLPASGQNL